MQKRRKQPVPAEVLLTPAEVAELFGVDPKTVTRWSRAGKLPAAVRTPGGHRRYKQSDLEPYLHPDYRPANTLVGTKWRLYCGEDYMYSTTDPREADEWFESDPTHHQAREVSE